MTLRQSLGESDFLQHHVCLNNEISLSSCTLEALYPQAAQLIKTSQFRLSRILSLSSLKNKTMQHIFSWSKVQWFLSDSILGGCHTLCHWPGGIWKFQLCNSLIHLPHIGCLRNGASRYTNAAYICHFTVYKKQQMGSTCLTPVTICCVVLYTTPTGCIQKKV